jgi:cell shape-determining protein MreC
LAKRLVVVERENARLREELRKAHIIIDVQKKVSRLLGIAPSDDEAES